MEKKPATILIDDDIPARMKTKARFSERLALLGLGQPAAVRRALRDAVRRDPSHPFARDHLFSP